jgi:hypothetical protein
MTDDEEYEESRKQVEHVFGERKALNKKFLSVCERKLDVMQSTENPTKYIIGKIAFQEFEDVWDNFEKIGLTLYYSIQNLDHRIQNLERSVDVIAEETNIDLSRIKKKIAELSRTVQHPLFDEVIKMFKEGKAEAEKRKKLGEETLDNLTRSH